MSYAAECTNLNAQLNLNSIILPEDSVKIEDDTPPAPRRARAAPWRHAWQL